jgi:hypothetical protein
MVFRRVTHWDSGGQGDETQMATIEEHFQKAHLKEMDKIVKSISKDMGYKKSSRRSRFADKAKSRKTAKLYNPLED